MDTVFSFEVHLGKRRSKHKFICFSEISKLASLGRGISHKQLNKMGHRRHRNAGSSVNGMDKKSFKNCFIVADVRMPVKKHLHLLPPKLHPSLLTDRDHSLKSCSTGLILGRIKISQRQWRGALSHAAPSPWSLWDMPILCTLKVPRMFGI